MRLRVAYGTLVPLVVIRGAHLQAAALLQAALGNSGLPSAIPLQLSAWGDDATISTSATASSDGLSSDAESTSGDTSPAEPARKRPRPGHVTSHVTPLITEEEPASLAGCWADDEVSRWLEPLDALASDALVGVEVVAGAGGSAGGSAGSRELR